MSQVNQTNIRTITNNIDLGPSGSLQFQFAKLQMALSQAAKENAMGYIDQIKDSQEEQKKITAFLNQARKLQSEAGGGCTAMPADMKQYMTDKGLTWDTTGSDDSHSKEQWNVAITALQGKLDQVGSSTQQLMVFVQDFMGQYNSYLQGSNSAIQQSNQTLSELARTR